MLTMNCNVLVILIKSHKWQHAFNVNANKTIQFHVKTLRESNCRNQTYKELQAQRNLCTALQSTTKSSTKSGCKIWSSRPSSQLKVDIGRWDSVVSVWWFTSEIILDEKGSFPLSWSLYYFPYCTATSKHPERWGGLPFATIIPLCT